MTSVEGHVKKCAVYMELEFRVLSLNLHQEGKMRLGLFALCLLKPDCPLM